MAKRKHGKRRAGKCARVRVCGKTRIICRSRNGRIKSNRPAGKRRR